MDIPQAALFVNWHDKHRRVIGFCKKDVKRHVPHRVNQSASSEPGRRRASVDACRPEWNGHMLTFTWLRTCCSFRCFGATWKPSLVKGSFVSVFREFGAWQLAMHPVSLSTPSYFRWRPHG
eukprot:6668476-Pyramimonas_sp.AAC.1